MHHVRNKYAIQLWHSCIVFLVRYGNLFFLAATVGASSTAMRVELSDSLIKMLEQRWKYLYSWIYLNGLESYTCHSSKHSSHCLLESFYLLLLFLLFFVGCLLAVFDGLLQGFLLLCRCLLSISVCNILTLFLFLSAIFLLLLVILLTVSVLLVFFSFLLLFSFLH